MTPIIGLDPGQSGGIALLTPDGEPYVWKMPGTERDLCDLLRSMPAGCHAWLEAVHAMPKQGVSSTWKFGQHYGLLRGFLIALQIPFDTVTPAKWQGALGCRSGGNKNITKAKAQEWYPLIKLTHATADALLIAEYGRRSVT